MPACLLLQVKSRQLKKLFEKYQVRDMSNALSMEHDRFWLPGRKGLSNCRHPAAPELEQQLQCWTSCCACLTMGSLTCQVALSSNLGHTCQLTWVTPVIESGSHLSVTYPPTYLQAKKAEITDLQEQFQREREGMLEDYRILTQQVRRRQWVACRQADASECLYITVEWHVGTGGQKDST
jgi:hypothetical protein